MHREYLYKFYDILRINSKALVFTFPPNKHTLALNLHFKFTFQKFSLKSVSTFKNVDNISDVLYLFFCQNCLIESPLLFSSRPHQSFPDASRIWPTYINCLYLARDLLYLQMDQKECDVWFIIIIFFMLILVWRWSKVKYDKYPLEFI